MRITIKEVAAEAGVSIKTVSRVINDEKGVTPFMRKKVLRVIKKLGYVANTSAARLASGKSRVLGLILPYINSAWSNTLLQSAVKTCDVLNYSMIVKAVPTEDFTSLVGLIKGKHVDGFLIVAPDDDILIEILIKEKTKFVVIQPDINIANHKKCMMVTTDDQKGSVEAIQYLVERGHKRIAFIGHNFKLVSCNQRFKGYKKVLESCNIKLNPSYICKSEGTYRGGYKTVQSLIKLKRPPTAVFAAIDEIAIGAVNGAVALGIRVPEDISVVGFDDIPLARELFPPLTTVSQPIEDVAIIAVKTLVMSIEKDAMKFGEQKLSTNLVIRSTTT